MYLLDKMSTKAQLAQQAKERKTKEKAQKRSLLSQLENICEELLRVRSDIDNCIRDECEETVARFKAKLYETVNISLLGNGEPFSKTVTFDISSLSEKLPKLRQKREEVYQQQLIIHGLMKKISSSEPIEYSELEMQIIAILSVKSFLESQAVAMLRGMINLCPSIRECLQLLKTYSEKFFKGMKYGPNENEHPHPHPDVHPHPDEDEDEDEDKSIPKKIGPETMQRFFEKLDTLLHQLTELKAKIDGIKADFSKGYSIDSLFSGCRVLSSLHESSRQLQDELEQKTLGFQTLRNEVVTFFEDEYRIRDDFFVLATEDYDFKSTFDTQFDEIDEQIKEAFEKIKLGF